MNTNRKADSETFNNSYLDDNSIGAKAIINLSSVSNPTSTDSLSFLQVKTMSIVVPPQFVN